MLYDDTIAAIATPPGAGGIGVVRLSGPQALPIARRMFAPARRGAWRPFLMRFGRVVAPGGAPVDEALAVYMRAPRSFTGEDVVEFSCHGGPLVLRAVLDLALEHGARQAGPGEFTMRAFLNGRIDLTRAEATLDVINARTAAGLALAQAQLGGWLAGEVRRAREALLAPLAYLTALIDFPEDHLDAEDALGPIRAGLTAVEGLLATADQGMVFRQGARVALVGVPNVGKSSLLNALLRADRAIVTPVPGTTRDTLEETADLAGIPVVLVDTAGIAATDDPVEQIGIERSRAALAQADLALLVLDATRPPTSDEQRIAALIGARPAVVVLNKTDLLGGAPPVRPALPPDLAGAPHIPISAREGAGLAHLARAVAAALGVAEAPAEPRLVSNPRHRDALFRAAGHLREALSGHAAGLPPELLVVDLTAALAALGEITGEGVGEELLDAIFSRFCIGK
ncbi:MAG TPA: tRNA uridine-5-carboxymethylaminomethyl(34) synthesis GTPase MnmE [Roseiflexaceae bacterium]|nr:tRNA uridine-5-carboxymethylaminomethyl(34) synthesis GTPase MnmE [Roseiflexaceae bacterium]